MKPRKRGVSSFSYALVDVRSQAVAYTLQRRRRSHDARTRTPRHCSRHVLTGALIDRGRNGYGFHVTLRMERIAENEAAFRAANDRIRAWPENEEASATQGILFLCECGDSQCFDRVTLSRSEYEAVRADSAHFALLPGHEVPEAERVVEVHDGFVVVEKSDDVRDIVEDTDPRRQ
jgi:hypothetical protein